MSTGQLPRFSYASGIQSTVRQRLQAWRLALLCLLLLCSIGLITLLRVTAPVFDQPLQSFVTLWLVSCIPYLGACLLVLTTQPSSGRGRWFELGLILLGALVLRLILLPLAPNLSHDSWRYLWDARVTLHGYSPYVYAPNNPVLEHLRNILYENSRFRNVPTLYPPGAQAVYLLSYLLAPDNLFAFKGMLLGLELVTIGSIVWLLYQKGLDLARCLIYAWCPLPIIEFALQGHHEAITIVFTLLALVCTYGQWRGSRALTGFFIAMAALTNIYPLLFLLVIVRRRDWFLLATCCATIVVAYIPYLILGRGMVLGFFSSYASEQTPNESIVPVSVHYVTALLHLDRTHTLLVGYGADLIVVGVVCLLLWWLRRSGRVSMEAGILVLTGTVFAVASHVYPWYTTELVPWVALLIGPLWLRKTGLIASGLAIVAAWYGALASITQYYFVSVANWSVYYLVVYAMVVVALALAAYVSRARVYTSRQKRDTAL
ncbi:MAG: hypothetical protein NVSMB44_17740 [Ktedonobacteraceae bacterium]